MAFLPSYAAKVMANDVSVCATVNAWNVTHTRAVSEVTAMCQTGQGANSYVPGLKGGTLTMAGPQDSVGQNLHAEIAGAVGVDNNLVITLLPDGDAVGKPAFFGTFDPTDHAIDASVAEAVGFTLAATPDEGVEAGFVIHALGAETADANGTSVDRSADLVSSALGAAAGLHVTAYSGFTTVGIKVQHSANNSTWADLVSFAAVTAVGAQVVKTAATDTVNRYLRVVTDVTGTGSITFLATVGPR